MNLITEFSSPKRTIYGINSISKLRDELINYTGNVLLISRGKTGKELPFHSEVLQLIKSVTKKIYVFDEVELEPSVKNIDSAGNYAREKKIELIIAVGGGSVMDLAKSVSILITNRHSIRDYQMGKEIIINPGIDIIAIPTTSGSGSEATKVAVITNEEENTKKSIAHPYLVPCLVIMDPNLTRTLPPKLTALTGIDALSHAIEAYTSTVEIPFANAVAIKAIELIGESLVECYKNPDDLNSRMKMQLASYMGGLSLIASVGAAHRLAQPISSVTGLTHSEAISLILINVMKENREYCKEKYRNIAIALGADISIMGLDAASEVAIEKVQSIFDDLEIKPGFREYLIESDIFSKIIDNANRATSHLIYNPKPLDDEILLKILLESK